MLSAWHMAAKNLLCFMAKTGKYIKSQFFLRFMQSVAQCLIFTIYFFKKAT